jgi:hypothetical protein
VRARPTKDVETNNISTAIAAAADIGIFTCRDPDQIQELGTACFKIMAPGAPAEWMMLVMWINYTLNMAYYFYTHDRIAVVVNAAYDTGSSPRTSMNTTECQGRGWNPGAEDFDLDKAPFLGEADYPAKSVDWTFRY